MVPHKKQAFTLIEILTVIAIIGVIMALLVPTIAGAMKQARTGAARADLAQLALALQRFHTDFGEYPPSAMPGYSLHDQDSDWDAEVFENLDTPGECLWFFLCTKFEAGNNDNKKREDALIDFEGDDLPEKWQILNKVSTGPYLEWKGKQLGDNDTDGIPALLSPFISKYEEADVYYGRWYPTASLRDTDTGDTKYLWDTGICWYIPYWQYDKDDEDELVFDTFGWVYAAERDEETDCYGELEEWENFPISQTDAKGNYCKEDSFQLYWLGPDGCVGYRQPPDRKDPDHLEQQRVGIGDDVVNW